MVAFFKQFGFSLVELLIALAIVGILAAVAMPTYNNYVQKSNRSVAKSALLDLAARQESYYALHNTYASQMTALGYAVTGNQMIIPSSTESRYTVTIASVSSTSVPPMYVLQAQPVANSIQATDKCNTYQLDSNGTKSNLDANGQAIADSSCW